MYALWDISAFILAPPPWPVHCCPLIYTNRDLGVARPFPCSPSNSHSPGCNRFLCSQRLQRLCATDGKANRGWMADACVWAEIFWSTAPGISSVDTYLLQAPHPSLSLYSLSSLPVSAFPRLCLLLVPKSTSLLFPPLAHCVPFLLPAVAQTACKLASYTVLSLSITLVPAGKIIYNFITLQGIVSFNCHNNQLVE